ncbi:cation:proton antiporter domain-containing protein [Xiamenia xianingshaonis]|uniref:Cation:proton antiporter n=1 Tax=Xiamenia xianingshaonis TaxID=2682776 RepID=A0A9E6SUV4_9ACTN|nr:cation:proton antiporter [Xiamenia xianingshaonis]NHM14421.1 sodium:proton exchanger [Xiamenia xianingshaonis]QTU84895.1 cation:proton antiporter [Xiamenia xianingshaonis]
MSHVPQLISDLALLLAVAAVATIACKRLRLPLVIGYVVAGFLVGPAATWFPNISDTANISVWSDIGVIFLMFGLGLEFSVIKLTQVGKSAAVTALTEMPAMIACGTALGMAFGWGWTTSIFLGGMLAISSSSIIVKTFSDLGVKKAGFAELVFGVLVIEDITAVFLLAVLSTIAAGSGDGAGAVAQIGQMALYLVVWFVCAVLLVPTALRRVSDHLNDEIILIASIALCLLMVMLAVAIGFSSALGAFLAGSILAGTTQAKRIDTLFHPIKDLFGAVFFVSVGMMVSPSAIVENAPAVIAIVALTMVGRSAFCTVGALLAGNSLRMSIKCGTSLGQIGEFSFIIAALGSALGVTPSFLYPVIVTVSVITALTTPVMVRNADRIYHGASKVLATGPLKRIRRKPKKTDEEETSFWKDYLKRWALNTAMVPVAAVAAEEILFGIVRRFLRHFVPDPFLAYGLAALGILVTGLFMANLFFSLRRDEFGVLWMRSRRNRLLLVGLAVASIAVSLASILYIEYAALGAAHRRASIVLFVLALVCMFVLGQSRFLHSLFLKLTTNFFANLSENILAERMESLSDEDHINWVERHIYLVDVEASRTLGLPRTATSPSLGVIGSERPRDYLFGIAHNLDLVAIERDGERIGSAVVTRLTKEDLTRRIANPIDPLGIREGDVLTFIGTEDEVDGYVLSMVEEETLTDAEADVAAKSLEEYLAAHPEKLDLTCFALDIAAGSPFAGKTIGAADFKGNYGSLVVAHVHEGLPKMKPSRHTRLFAGDRIWLIGDPADAAPLLVQASIVGEEIGELIESDELAAPAACDKPAATDGQADAAKTAFPHIMR